MKAGNALVLILTDNGDTARTLTSYVTSATIDLKGHGLVDVTTMGASGMTWASDELEDCSFTVEFLYAAGTGLVWDALAGATNGLRTATAAKAFEIGPQGSATGGPKISGTCWLEDVSMPVAIGDMIRMSATFRVNGAATVGAY